MSMSTAGAQTAVVTVGAGVVGIAILTAARHGQRPPARRILGAGIATFGLSALANGAPGIAGPLALLWGASALIVSGGPALSSIVKATSAPAPASPATRPNTYTV